MLQTTMAAQPVEMHPGGWHAWSSKQMAVLRCFAAQLDSMFSSLTQLNIAGHEHHS